MRMLFYHQVTAGIFALFALTTFSSCKDKCRAGTGGDLTFVLKPMHHSNPIVGATVRIKFSAQDFPGENGEYDMILAAGAQEASITVTGLKCGEYYLYGTGIDSTLAGPDYSVRGGIPYSTEKESGTIELIIPVTEGGPH